MDRRTLIRGMCVGGLATWVAPTVTFARVPGDKKLVFVLLRGGFDGLAAVVPVGDPAYAALRGSMAFEAGALTPLADGFALAPGLAPLRELWNAQQMVVAHAMAIPFRTRSHFDGQAVLETGLDRPSGGSDGWLNRLLQVMDGQSSGIAVAAGLPRSMDGAHPVLTWSPAALGSVDDAYLDRMHLLYRSDPMLHDRFEAALQLRDLEDVAGMDGPRAGGRFDPVMRAASRFLREPDGPNVAALEFSGWDTHAGQGMVGGRLDTLLSRLADGLLLLRNELGPAWDDTTVVVMTEFGRTARPNGTGGTDHGTAGAGFVLGPGVARSAVISDWPGLGERDLFEGRDVRATLDTRSLLKGVLGGVFDLTTGQANRVFPGSDDVRPVWTSMR